MNRNGGRDGYRACAADRRAEQQRARPKVSVLEADPVLAAHVAARLRAKDSPMTIAVELRGGVYPGIGGRVSHETLYQEVDAQGRQGVAQGAPRASPPGPACRKRRRAGGEIEPAKAGPLGEFNLIFERRAIAAERVEVGHFEGDLIVGAFNRSAIVTVFDRASRYLHLAEFAEDHGADATLAALVEIFERVPELRRVLPTDCGRGGDLRDHCGGRRGVAATLRACRRRPNRWIDTDAILVSEHARAARC